MSRERCDWLSILFEVALRLRKLGLRVGTSEIVDAARVAVNLALLAGSEEPSVEDVETAAIAVFARSERDEELIKKVFREMRGAKQHNVNRMIAAVEEDLRKLGLSWGARIYSKRRLLSGPRAEEKREAYSRLRLLGLIVRTPRGDMVVDREAALRRLRSIARSYSSPWEALADSAARMISRGRIDWFALYAAPVDEEKLAGVEIDRIASAALQALQEGNRGLARKLAGIIAKRLESGEVPRDSWAAFRLLSELDELNARSLASLLRGEPRLVERLLKNSRLRDMLAEALRYLDAGSLKEVVRKLVKDRRGLPLAAGLVGEVDLSVWADVSFSRQPRSWEEAVIAAASSLARAERGFLAAASGDAAQLDMALYELERFRRIDYSAAPDWAIAALERYAERVEALKDAFEGDADTLVKLSSIVRRMSPEDALLYLRDVYRSSDEGLKRTALRLAEIIWRRLEARVSKLTARSKSFELDARGRVDVRRTLYNLISMRENPIVARRKKRKPLFALVLDTSGSMAKYAVWAMVGASAFSSLVDSLTLFASDVTLVRGAGRLTRRMLIELLFSVEFSGYTNISLALRETARLYDRAARMLVVTDLCQTIEDDAPHRVVSELSQRGWRLYFLLPPKHCANERERVAEYAVVRVASRPEEIPRLFARIL